MGLLQTRSARTARDGHFEVGFSKIFPYERYLITIQALPWLEATFRYTSVSNRNFAGGEGGEDIGTSFKDRGADLKFSLVREGRYVPEIAVGLQDGLGTGVFSGEYLVASKRYRDFDFSLGIGWGYLAGNGEIKNPLASISDTFKRRGGGAQQGGTLLATNYFTGPNVGLFGGVEYTTPIKGVSLKVEYDPNDYVVEPLANPLISSSHINYGVVFQPFSWVNLSLARERGQEYMFRASLRTNFNDPGIPKLDPPPPALKPRPAPKGNILAGATGPIRESERTAMVRVLSDDSLDVTWASVQNDQVYLGLESPSAEDMWRAGKIATSFLPAQEGFVSVSSTAGETIRVSYEEAQREMPIDYLFDEFARTGVEPAAIEINSDGLTIEVIAPMTREEAQAAVSFAAAAFPNEPVWLLDEHGTLLASRDISPLASPQADGQEVASLARMRPIRALDIGASAGATSRAITWTFEEEKAFADAVLAAAEEYGVVINGTRLTGQRATIVLAGGPFRQVARNVGRAARLAADNAPRAVEEIEIVSESAGLEINRVLVFRHELEAAGRGDVTGSAEEIWSHATVTGPQRRDANIIAPPGAFPDFSYGISPLLRQHVGSGDRFYLYQLFLKFSGAVQLSRGVSINGSVGVDLYNNFDRLTAPPDSNLPNVRSNIKRYLQEGENNLIRLQTNYLWSPYPDIYLRGTAGYFEENYGGFGGEFLYRPFGGRVAFGVDVNYVRQRGFDQRLSFLDYSVLTGHLNIYYDIPIYDLLGQLHVGQYLAGDKGATFQVSRRFDNGMRAGAFFTLTDVPFSVFGEGSFDKGFFISIPFDLFSTRSSTNAGLFAFRPLTRDGGQRVNVRPRLYDVTASGNLDNIDRDWDRFLE